MDLWVYIVGEFYREHIGDELLHLRRKRNVRDADHALTYLDLLAGLIDQRHLRKRVLVEKNVRTGGPIRLEQNVESRRGRGRRSIRVRKRDLEVDLDQHRGAADAHRRDRRIDLHIAVFCGLAGNKGDGAGNQAEQR